MKSFTAISCLTYRDPNKAVDWLCRAFGFTPDAVYKDDEDTVIHAQLVHGSGMIMLGPDRKGSLADYMATPERAGGLCTQIVYVVVEDADAHCEKAKSEGAEIVVELKDEDYGGRDYTCRDLEGNLWSFGTYDPWVKAQA